MVPQQLNQTSEDAAKQILKCDKMVKGIVLVLVILIGKNSDGFHLKGVARISD